MMVMGKYNSLVKLDQSVNQSWAQVQNVYQRRADLIPNLVNTVQGAANFEKSTIIAVTEARASVGRVQINANQAPTNAATAQQFQAAQGELSNALSRLLVVAERYPELKANANFQAAPSAAWKEPKTESRSSAETSTRRSRLITLRCALFRRCFSRACWAFNRSRFSMRNPERRKRRR